jgi:hypothetical protein
MNSTLRLPAGMTMPPILVAPLKYGLVASYAASGLL